MNEIRLSFKNILEPVITNKYHQYLFSIDPKAKKISQTAKGDYFILHFDYYPTIWVSNNNQSTFNVFERFFKSLNIENYLKEKLDYDKDIIMYSGFFVIGNQSPVELWHSDYPKGANGYTLITPLYELDLQHGNLLYKDKDDQISTYKYKKNEAILVGENFQHTTEPYLECEKIRVLVSLTIGTDKLKYWKKLKNYMKSQSDFFKLPCGHINGSCNCLRFRYINQFFNLLK